MIHAFIEGPHRKRCGLVGGVGIREPGLGGGKVQRVQTPDHEGIRALGAVQNGIGNANPADPGGEARKFVSSLRSRRRIEPLRLQCAMQSSRHLYPH